MLDAEIRVAVRRVQRKNTSAARSNRPLGSCRRWMLPRNAASLRSRASSDIDAFVDETRSATEKARYTSVSPRGGPGGAAAAHLSAKGVPPPGNHAAATGSSGAPSVHNASRPRAPT